MSETTNVMNSEVVKRLLCYVSYDTQSKDESSEVPSTQKQFDLAKVLKKELEEIGALDVRLSDHCYVYAKIPSNLDKKVPAIGFIAHMDTSPALSGKDIKPQIIQNYDGGVIKLGESGFSMGPNEFPALAELKGKSLITTDGTTLLGADDKAGVAEIMTMAAFFLAHPEVKHGDICIAFTPDEEVGNGVEYFDVPGFGADFAYTVDGGPEGEIQFENFNAASADFYVHGVNVHPGEAKGIMKNSQKIAMEIQGMLPVDEAPEYTEGYEGFFHLMEMTGTVEETKMSYLIRDFNSESYENRKELLRNITEIVNKKYGEGTVELKLNDSYRNMREKIEPCMELIEYAKKACEMAEVKADIAPIRGGTDGARLSFVGLPCPNLGTGGYGFHGAFEHITAEGMDKATVIIKNIILQFAE